MAVPYSIPALVVDDEDMNVDIMKELLLAQNYESDIALNERKALQLFEDRIEKVRQGEAEMYKIVLLDYSMPGIGGLEVARIICKLVHEYNLKKPYLCCCTAYTSEKYRNIAISAGFDRFLTKPVTADDIVDII